MPYYPKSRYSKPLKSNPNEIFTMDGKPYDGLYVITFDGEMYTGEKPTKKSLNLQKIEVKDNINSKKINGNIENIKYSNLNGNNLQEFLEPTQYYPIITDKEYEEQRMIRYFAKQRKLRNFKFIEINKEIYDDIVNQKGIYNYPGWDVMSMLWIISNGKLNEDFVKNQNIRITEEKNKQFIGLINYIQNYTQFSKF